MTTWIPINLPWRNREAFREVDRLSDLYVAWFDAETEQLFGPVPDPDWDGRHINDVIESCPELGTTDWSDAVTYEYFVEKHTDADIRIVAYRRRHLALRNQFQASDSRCAEWQRKIADADFQARSQQFCDHEMRRAGVALEIRSTNGELRRVIIGDADACGYDMAMPQIADDDVIVRCMDLRRIVEETP